MHILRVAIIVISSASLCFAADSQSKDTAVKATTQQAAMETAATTQKATTQPTEGGPKNTPSGKKPILKVEKSGLPSGHDSPEGVACDLARAFINRDAKLFRETCIAPYGQGENRKAYEEFLQKTEAAIKAEAEKTEPSPGGPKTIGKLFAARHLSLNGPASAGFAIFNFQDIMFVDVGVFLQNGRKTLNRTLVIKKADGKWYVHPAPTIDPLISMGLNDEAKSEKDFTEVYDTQK